MRIGMMVLVEGRKVVAVDEKLVAWIRAKGGDVTPWMVRSGCRWLRGSGLAKAALGALVDEGMGRWVVRKPDGAGRPKTVFVLGEGLDG